MQQAGAQVQLLAGVEMLQELRDKSRCITAGKTHLKLGKDRFSLGPFQPLPASGSSKLQTGLCS